MWHNEPVKKNILTAFVGLSLLFPSVYAEGRCIYSPGNPNHPEFSVHGDKLHYKSAMLILLLDYRDEKVSRDKVMEHIRSHPEELNDMLSAHVSTMTPLSIAFYLNDEEMVALMLEKGAIPFPSARSYYWGAKRETDPKYAKVFSLIRKAQDNYFVFHRILEQQASEKK